MTTILRRTGATVGFAALVSTGGAAFAQDPAASTEVSGSAEYSAGDGITVSEDLVLHPRVEVEGGYQSNVFFTAPEDEGGVDSSPLLRVGVGASLGNPNSGEVASRFQLTGDVQLTWNQYLSDQDVVTDQSDLGVQALLDAAFNPKGAVTFTLRDVFSRQVNPPPAEFADDVDRDKNTLSAILSVKPGGGALEVYGGASWTVDFFESDTFEFANRNSLEFKVGTRWQWLPKTQLNAEASMGVIFIEDNALRVDRETATPLRVTVGLSTLITSNFGVIARVGYGNSLQSSVAFNNYIALAEARYAFGPQLKFAAGYSHDFADSIFGNFREDHMLYARMAALIAGRLSIHAKGEVRFRAYEGVPEMDMESGFIFCGNDSMPCNKPTTRDDLVYRFTPALNYQLSPWLTMGVDYSYYKVDTDARLLGGGSSMNREDSFAFTWHEVTANVRARF